MSKQYKWVIKRDTSSLRTLAPYLAKKAWYTKELSEAMLFDSQHAAIAYLAATSFDDAWNDGTYHGDVLSLVKVAVETKQIVVEVK